MEECKHFNNNNDKNSNKDTLSKSRVLYTSIN